MEEEWREIEGYSDYQVSNFGRIRSFKKDKKGHIMSPAITHRGYYRIRLSNKNNEYKMFYVHRLVLTAFSPTENMDKLQVNHIDENKLNNNLSNLEWCDAKYNINYGTGIDRRKNSNIKAIVCLETKECFDSVTQAAQKFGLFTGNICKVLIGKRNVTGGYHFLYKEDYEKMTPDEIKIFLENHPSAVRPIICLETNKIYDFEMEAAKELNLNQTAISAACRKKANTAGGYHFLFLEDYNKMNKEEIDNYIKEKKQGGKNAKIKIKCLETEEIFESITDAARKLKIDSSAISKVLRGKLKSTGGYHFEKLEE